MPKPAAAAIKKKRPSAARAKPAPVARAKRSGAEEQVFLEALVANKQVQTKPGELAPGVTHVLKRKRGGVVLQRKRFSAV